MKATLQMLNTKASLPPFPKPQKLSDLPVALHRLGITNEPPQSLDLFGYLGGRSSDLGEMRKKKKKVEHKNTDVIVKGGHLDVTRNKLLTSGSVLGSLRTRVSENTVLVW